MRFLVTLAILLSGCTHLEAPPSGSKDSTVRFDYSATDIDNLCREESSKLLRKMDEIGKRPSAEAVFATSVGAMEAATGEFSTRLNPVLFLKYVGSDPEVRATADRCETSVEKLFVDIFMREDLYLAAKQAQLTEKKLDPKETKLLDEYLIEFKRNGLELPPEKRMIFAEKKKELVALEAEFSKNLVEWKDFLEVSEKSLEGMDKGYIESLEKMPNGHYKITLSYPHYYPFMSEGKDASVRKSLQQKFDSRGGEKNKEILDKAVILRQELAQMLGFKNHAQYVLERRMAKTPEAVKAFLDRLVAKLKPQGKKDLAGLLEVKRKDLGNPSEKEVFGWDWRYYHTLSKKQKHSVDPQEIKEYFPVERVLTGMFSIYETLLGVKFQKVENPVRWHSAVNLYQVKKGDNVVAAFYMDLYPRDGKYGHAAAFTLVGGYKREDGSYQPPISAIVANFNPPSSATPSLLTHDQVETLFHEFGHIMHQQLTTARFPTFSGTRVKRDFVEAPSQMLENWAWEKEPLARLSSHYKTGKPLPDELVQKMINAKLADSGITYLRQLFLGVFDLTLHTTKVPNTTELYKKLAKDIMLIPIQDGTTPQASFGHLMGGYDSGYYGYLWSKVFAQDMFSRFEKEGLLNTQTGTEYRQWILEPGGEKEPGDLIRGFLGRDPNEKAFLKSLGLGS